jgi:hypothetical protein
MAADCLQMLDEWTNVDNGCDMRSQNNATPTQSRQLCGIEIANKIFSLAQKAQGGGGSG